MQRLLRVWFLTFGFVVLLVLTVNAVPANTVIQGTPKQIGQGTASSYVTLNRRGQISELGIILSESVLSGLPSNMTEIDLALPPQAIRATPFTHIGLNWNPQGHPPLPIYGTPHFDLHFYTISQAARQRITATGDDVKRAYKTPEARLVPAGYVLAPDSAIPGEGSHWINPKASEFQGGPHGFDHTFIYGFYNGKMDFLEPMISKAVLEQHQKFNDTVARPARYSTPGSYPSQYSVDYNAQAHQFRISLNGFAR